MVVVLPGAAFRCRLALQVLAAAELLRAAVCLFPPAPRAPGAAALLAVNRRLPAAVLLPLLAAAFPRVATAARAIRPIQMIAARAASVRSTITLHNKSQDSPRLRPAVVKLLRVKVLELRRLLPVSADLQVRRALRLPVRLTAAASASLPAPPASVGSRLRPPSQLAA